MRRSLFVLVAWLLAAGASLGGAAGCARDTRTVHRDTAVVHATPAATAGGTVVSEQHSVYSHQADDDEPRGVLSTAVHFVGEVLALPFRIVGGVLRAIF